MKKEINIVEPHKTCFCSYCGEQMIESMRGAEENLMFCWYSEIPLAGKYDRKTGKRNWCYYYKCPNYKKKEWYEFAGSPHDEYFIDKVINI